MCQREKLRSGFWKKILLRWTTFSHWSSHREREREREKETHSHTLTVSLCMRFDPTFDIKRQSFWVFIRLSKEALKEDNCRHLLNFSFLSFDFLHGNFLSGVFQANFSASFQNKHKTLSFLFLPFNPLWTNTHTHTQPSWTFVQFKTSNQWKKEEEGKHALSTRLVYLFHWMIKWVRQRERERSRKRRFRLF